MSRGGSFDQSGAGLELCVGWRKRRKVVLSNTDLIQEVLRNPQTSAQLFGIDPGPHNGAGPGGVGKAQSAKASSMVLMLYLLLHRHAVPLTSPATRSIC